MVHSVSTGLGSSGSVGGGMRFWDKSRPTLPNGWPTWVGQNVALPSVYVFPLEDEESGDPSDPRFRVGMILVGEDGGANWEYRDWLLSELRAFLLTWKDNPEEALRDWFGREPPKGKVRRVVEEPVQDAVSVDKSLDEMGL